MSDITKEFLEELNSEFAKRYYSNKKISSLVNKLKNGKATSQDAFDYAKEVGNIRKLVLHDYITDEILNDGYLGYKNALTLFDDVLYKNYELINNYCKNTFSQTNKNAGLNINGVEINYDQDKTNGIIECAVKDRYTVTRNETEEAVVTNAKCYYDSSVRKNADFQYKSGLNPKIIRTAVGKTCKWCQSLAGTYDYRTLSEDDVFRRHSNCDCLVVYQPYKGEYQDVWSKRVMDSSEFEQEKIKRIEFSKPQKFKYKDVTRIYFDDATPKKGNVDFDTNYDMSNDTIDERRNMKLIHDIFGGDIYAIEHTNYDYKIADYIWNEAYWELKNPEKLSGIDKLVQKGLQQISKNPGGLIVDCGNYNLPTDKVIEEIEGRLFRKENKDLSLDIIIVKKNKIIKVLRY